MSVDFLAAAWSSRCLLSVDGKPVLRASGIIKVPSEESHKRSIAHLFD